jgi:hypothetical protein
MSRRVVIGTVIVLLSVGVMGLLPTGAAIHEDTSDAPPLTTPEGFTNAAFEIRVFENGSARWIVRASRSLSTSNQTELEQFREFEQSFESTETTAFRDFQTNARELTAIGTDATGRQMNATGFARDARISRLGQTRGIVELSFVWTNFATTDGQRVIVGDIFDGGFFIDTDQSFVVSHGPNLVFESVAPPPDSQTIEDNLTASDTVTWLGERRFPDNRPRAVLVPPEAVNGTAASTGATTGTPTTATGTPGAGTATPDGFGLTALVAFVVLVVLGLGGGFAWYTGAFSPTRRAADPDTQTETTTITTTRTTPTPQPSEPAVPDEEFLSDEERVLKLLEENGGRMKQVNIVDETDWSKSKVSMLLSDMEDEGQISKLRVGRENIVSKAGEEPDAAGSPFEEE